MRSLPPEVPDVWGQILSTDSVAKAYRSGGFPMWDDALLFLLAFGKESTGVSVWIGRGSL